MKRLVTFPMGVGEERLGEGKQTASAGHSLNEEDQRDGTGVAGGNWCRRRFSENPNS